HGGFYQAVADGSYAACGLDVTIRPGGPQVNNRALMSAGKIDFYMGGNLLYAFSAVEQGIPSRIVAAIFQKDPQVLLSHPGAAKSFEELKDLDVMLISDSGFQSFYRWLMTDYGFPADKRRPYTFNSAPFVTNPRAVQQGYVTSEPFAIEREAGFAPDIWLLADHGFSTYATTIETMQATIDERPEVVQCFVDASIIGWYNFFYHDNSAAIARIKADNPDMTDAQIAFSIAKLKEFGIVDSGDAKRLGIGAITDARVKDFYDKMVRAGVVAAGLDIARAYTTDFVNRGVGLDLAPGN
ncbi:MAG: ABC transporter substrate-binding protein, partial [Alphaproteobacteria bacterium]